MSNVATPTHQPVPLRNDPKKVAIASMIGTAIEFYDYYIYAAAAVLVFNTQFFDKSDEKAGMLYSLSTLALSFIARPVGSALFGHYGDKLGRKHTLVASLLTMGLSTVCIGLLPTYAQAGVLAPILLCILRIAQGIGLGGEWGGAALVATENAPEGKRAWYGIFPQLGAPTGLFLANAVFFILSYTLGKEALVQWAWRIPFLISILLVGVGLWVRLKLHESHVYQVAEVQGKKLDTPVLTVMTKYWKNMVQGTLVMTMTYVIFYIMTAFAQVYSKNPAKLSAAGHPTGLGIEPNTFTGYLLIGALVFGLFTIVSGLGANKVGRRKWVASVTIACMIFALFIPSLLTNGTPTSVFLFLIIGMGLLGLTYGPMATVLPELFPTEVRYSGASLCYNLAAIIGASIPAIYAIKLNEDYGMMGVGIYMFLNGFLTLGAVLSIKETKDVSLME